MFHPVGPQPPSVYWRRRLLLVTSVVVLLVLLVMTVKIITSGGSDPAGAAATPRTSAAASTTTTPTTHAATSPSRTTGVRTSSATRAGRSTTPVPPTCRASDLAVVAVVGKDAYQVGDQPLLELQVTNTGAGPCVQDLADRQVELKVYNGESRVWGSHDCKIQPGTDDRTLAPNQPVRVAITWTGLSSRPGCSGTRQRVGAGTYTLYAALSGQTGKATQFTIG